MSIEGKFLAVSHLPLLSQWKLLNDLS